MYRNEFVSVRSRPQRLALDSRPLRGCDRRLFHRSVNRHDDPRIGASVAAFVAINKARDRRISSESPGASAKNFCATNSEILRIQ